MTELKTAILQFDEKFLSESIGMEDVEFLVELYGLYLEQASKVIESMMVCRVERDFEYLGQLSHKIKSSSRSVGAIAMGNLLEAIERAARDKNASELQVYLHELPQLAEDIFEKIENHINVLKSS
ncbi:MAG: hypothetical protein CMK46_03390 [Porticoccus sp.]|mgnify:CR=1 FL=1|nr:hypothetical protein [Porticoccus sp.]PHS74488.1 MAG: hypothetical protein COB19_06610 [Porticoccus sp.]|tara:strand:- start:8007 stop:8381 length:375 start_codon:yes stop_codon:yes gene_type:complete